MTERSFDEMIAYFNRRVSEMDIAQDCKIELLGMVTALGYKHEKTAQQWIPCNWHKDNEKLPAECKSVLICIEDELGKYVDVSYRTDYNRWERYGRNVNVVAWKPLPEPWKGEQE